MSAEDPRAGKHVVFRLSAEEYAIPVAHVQEILGSMQITPVPGAPAAVRGVIHRRGQIIPVVDLRLRLGFPAQDQGTETAIIVVRTGSGRAKISSGLIVDEVVEVMDVLARDIQEMPDFGTEATPSHLLGVAIGRGRVRILLAIEEVLRQPSRPEQPR